MLRKLWMDDAGVISLEYLLLSVVVGLGMAVGFSALSDSLNSEYVELGQAILHIDTGYFINSQWVTGDNGNEFGFKGGEVVTDSADTITYDHGSINHPNAALSEGTGTVSASP